MKPPEPRRVRVTVNGTPHERTIEPRLTLADFLREELHLTGTHLGCEHGVCGACTVRLDGAVVRGCLVLAVQCDGQNVETIEGASDSGRIADLQAAFSRRNALQCGYCTPGVLLTLTELLAANPAPSEAAVREALSGHLCRCTGYQNIVAAALEAARLVR